VNGSELTWVSAVGLGADRTAADEAANEAAGTGTATRLITVTSTSRAVRIPVIVAFPAPDHNQKNRTAGSHHASVLNDKDFYPERTRGVSPIDTIEPTAFARSTL